MPRTCGCSGGKCTPSVSELSRREFLQFLGVGAAALWGGGALASQVAASPTPPSLGGQFPLYPMTAPRVYGGSALGAVAMPIGGIGTGSIWLDGAARLRVWQIFNNDSEERVPDSFFAIRVRKGSAPADVRILETAEEYGLAPMRELSFEGGYPIARVRYASDLPVSVSLDAFNPMIPTDVPNSSLPCALFRFRVRNDSGEPLDVSLLGSLQNAVGYTGWGAISERRHEGFGRNRNLPSVEAGLTAVSLEQLSDPPSPGFLRVVRNGETVPTQPLLYLDRLDGADGTVGAGPAAVSRLTALARLTGQKATAVAAEATSSFFETLARAVDLPKGGASVEVFEDFEKPSYEGWTVDGTAFGSEPPEGTLQGQQAVSGFLGAGLVNSFLGGDGPRGRLISRTFAIERRYIGFLIGGGSQSGATCINLVVGDQVVRTATGRDLEELVPHSWDVADLAGKEARLEIVDESSGGWGHINIDHIVFADIAPDAYLKLLAPFVGLAEATGLTYSSVDVRSFAGVLSAVETDAMGGDLETPWAFTELVDLSGLSSSKGQIRTLAATHDGAPVLIEVPLGEARLVLALAPGMPWEWAEAVLLRAGRAPKGADLETTRSGWGSMALATDHAGAKPLASWTDPQAMLAEFEASGSFGGGEFGGPSPDGETINTAIAAPFTLQPNEERVVSFAITWRFPNAERFGHQGNWYCSLFPDALGAARYVLANLERLSERTELYHRTVYESNIPEEFLDAMTSQSVILRSPVCWRSAEGYFAGFEGAYGCCPLNCTHVWNYAHTHARLFPEIGRNMRVSNFVTWLHPDGETSHREFPGTGAFADGHCACIVAALREHQLSADDGFLRSIWPGVRKAMEWFIRTFDAQEEGLTRGHQWNTYDTAVSGLNTFIGSQYLAALAASERLAVAMRDEDSRARWQEIRERGMAAQNEQLWSGRWYIQKPEAQPAHDYNNGCHSDQLLGQWWAHQLGLGRLFPRGRTTGALRSIYRHNLRPDFAGLEQIPRRYIDDGDGGLYMCTWPGNDRPDPYTLYSIEVWTGIEYSTAGLMVSEGLLDEARTIVRTARSRYDGRPRKDLNSGGGVCGAGNPFQELECGKFYARAQSSWSLLIASQGQILDGPRGTVGFEPRWKPEDHRSFFTVPLGWGLFRQQRRLPGLQEEHLELRHGTLSVRELVFSVGEGESVTGASVRVGDRDLACRVADPEPGDPRSRVRVRLSREAQLREGDTLKAELRTS